MTEHDVKRGARLALAVAAALSAGACGGGDDEDGVAGASEALVCIGGNECKGMSECEGGPGNSACAGMNECKGMGWSYSKTEKECTDAGGKVES